MTLDVGPGLVVDDVTNSRPRQFKPTGDLGGTVTLDVVHGPDDLDDPLGQLG